MSFPNGPVCSTSTFGGSVSTTSNYYLEADGDTLKITTSKTPSSSSATGYTGEICWDPNYIYVCTDINTWKRVGLSTF
jgi:hypothetical protein